MSAEPACRMLESQPVPDMPATNFDREVYCLLGLPFDAVSLRQVAEAVRDAARRRRRCFITTPNLNYVIACRDDEELRGSVLRSELSVADGMPMIWAARLLGIPLPERVAGSSLFDELRQVGPEPLSVFFFGGSDGVAGAACAALNETHAGLTCAGSFSPGFGSVAEMGSPAIHEAIDQSGADFLVVALPARKGQMWILANLARLSPPVVANLGAVVNFVAGTVIRAPSRWQRLGLEWVWRIREEPQLWRRYLHDGGALVGLLFAQVFLEMIVMRVKPPAAAAVRGARVVSRVGAGSGALTLSGAWTAGNVGDLRVALRAVTEQRCDVAVDLANVVYLDRACIGSLLLLLGHQAKVGRGLTFSSLRPGVLRQLRRSGAAYLLTSGITPTLHRDQ